jgi:hypothetical protein
MDSSATLYREQEQCLFDAYEQVIQDLSHVTGYPVKLTKAAKRSAKKWPASPESDGDRMRYCLPGPGNRFALARLSFPDEVKNDSFAQKCIERFTGFAERMGRAVKNVDDVKRILVKDEPLLWEDIIVSATYSESSDKLSVLSIIAASRDFLFMKHEGRPLEQGLLMTWDQSRLREEAETHAYSLLSFSRELNYRDAMKEFKSISQLSDGRNSLLVVNQEGRLKYLLRFHESQSDGEATEWEIVPQRFRHLKNILFNQDLILVVTFHSELVFLNRTGVLKLTGNMWHRITGTPLTYYLKGYLSEENSRRLSEMLVEMSALKIGASILITEKAGPLIDSSRKGVVREFKESSLGNIATVNRQWFLKMAGIDGCTIIGSDGGILNAGVILTLPERFTKGEEGARSAATRYGSTFGLGIKVSADGPMTVYEKGVPQRNIA